MTDGQLSLDELARDVVPVAETERELDATDRRELELVELARPVLADVARGRRRRLIDALGYCSSDVSPSDVIRSVEAMIATGPFAR